MKINSFQNQVCVPIPDVIPQFKMSLVQDEEHAVLGHDGKTVTTEIVTVSRTVPIPHEEFENKGVTCDLFGVEVSQKAGVQLHEFTSQFYGVPLDSREQLENIVNDSLDKIEASSVKS